MDLNQYEAFLAFLDKVLKEEDVKGVTLKIRLPDLETLRGIDFEKLAVDLGREKKDKDKPLADILSDFYHQVHSRCVRPGGRLELDLTLLAWTHKKYYLDKIDSTS